MATERILTFKEKIRRGETDYVCLIADGVQAEQAVGTPECTFTHVLQ
jgi:hypothetical protein